MPPKFRKHAKLTKEAKKEVKMLTSRLLEISVKMDEYIYYKKAIGSREAKCYLEELITYEKRFCLDVRSKQVVEKLVNFMQRIIEEEDEVLRGNGTLGNFETNALPSQTFNENSMQSISFSGNRLTSNFDSDSLNGPKGYEGNMNPIVDVDINCNEKNCSQLNERQGIERSESFQINNEQVSVLSQSVLRDHSYTSWEGPKYHEDDITYTPNAKRNAFVAQPRSLIGPTQKNMMIIPAQNAAVAKKYVLVKIPGNRSKTPSPAKYIKIHPIPRRDFNVPPPIYARTISNESSKRLLFKNINANSNLPATGKLPCLQRNIGVQMVPKKLALPVVATENKNDGAYCKKPRKKRNTNSKVQSDDEKVIKPAKKRGKRNSSQETNKSIENAAGGKKKKTKNKLKPNEEDLSWVENLKFVRVIEKDEVCRNMNITDAFWRNLEYPQEWDDGVYLM